MNPSVRPTRRIGWLRSCALCFAVLTGCGESLQPASEPAQARPILIKALDAWKQGTKIESLALGSPPLRILDRDWSGGSTLVSYEFKGESQKLGLDIQQPVDLVLKTPAGKEVKKTVNYLVTTGDKPMITRQDADD